jgi:hypothetical protein
MLPSSISYIVVLTICYIKVVCFVSQFLEEIFHTPLSIQFYMQVGRKEQWSHFVPGVTKISWMDWLETKNISVKHVISVSRPDVPFAEKSFLNPTNTT